MANDINSVILVGRLTRDAEMRYTNSGMAICKFSVAVNRRKRSGDQWTDEVNFFDITLFGKSAEGVHQYLVKGKQVAIQGELRQNRWEQDGQTRSKVEIVAQNLELLGGEGLLLQEEDLFAREQSLLSSTIQVLGRKILMTIYPFKLLETRRIVHG